MVYIMKQNLTLWVRNPEFSFGGGFATSVSLRNATLLSSTHSIHTLFITIIKPAYAGRTE